VYFSTSFRERKQNRNFKWQYKEENQEFSVAIRPTSSSAFENNEDKHKSGLCRLPRKKTQKFALQTKSRSDLRTKKGKVDPKTGHEGPE
jgi:hypothetical protein